jgi:hypothetical protein
MVVILALLIRAWRALRFVNKPMVEKIVFAFFFTQTSLSALIASFSFYKFSEREKLIVLVGVLFSFSCLFNVAQYMALESGQIPLMNFIGSLFEVIFLVIAGFIYDRATQQRLRSIIVVVTLLFLLGWLVNVIFFQTDSITSITKLASSLILLFYCISFYYRLMVDLPAVHLHHLPMFWINSALLLYSAGTVFLWAFVEYVIKVYYDTFVYYWVFNLALFVLQQIVIMVAVFYDLRKLTTPTLEIK